MLLNACLAWWLLILHHHATASADHRYHRIQWTIQASILNFPLFCLVNIFLKDGVQHSSQQFNKHTLKQDSPLGDWLTGA